MYYTMNALFFISFFSLLELCKCTIKLINSFASTMVLFPKVLATVEGQHFGPLLSFCLCTVFRSIYKICNAFPKGSSTNGRCYWRSLRFGKTRKGIIHSETHNHAIHSIAIFTRPPPLPAQAHESSELKTNHAVPHPV